MIQARGVAERRRDGLELEDHLGESGQGEGGAHARHRAGVVVFRAGAPVADRPADDRARAKQPSSFPPTPARRPRRKAATSASSVQVRPPIMVRVKDALARCDLIDCTRRPSPWAAT